MNQPACGTPLWQPATFAARGAAVPFTTPALAGTRVRLAAAGVELIVPQPGGMRGAYLIGLPELGNFCAATLHDLMLAERLGTLRAVTPHAVRMLARGVAAEGAAGRKARAAALTAAAADTQATQAATLSILTALVTQCDGAACPPAELERRAKAAILRLSPRLGRAPSLITDDLEALAGLYAAPGAGPSAPAALVPRTIAALRGVADSALHLADVSEGAAQTAPRLVAEAAQVTLILALRVLHDAWARLNDLPALLASQAAYAPALAAMLQRPSWALDGWSAICHVWALGAETAPRAAMDEMARMTASIPAEAALWLGAEVDESARHRLRRALHRAEDWRTGTAVSALIARNEQVRALAA